MPLLPTSNFEANRMETQKRLHDRPLVFDRKHTVLIDRCLMRLADHIASPLVMLADVSGGQYEILDWQNGRFKVMKEVSAPKTTIETNWDFLLMEGLRRLDDRRAEKAGEGVEADPENLFSNLSDADAAVLQEMLAQQKENTKMANIEQTLNGAMNIDGAVAAALVDWESGLTLGTAGGGNGFNIDLAAAGNTNVVKSKMNVMRDLKLKGGIEDILITLTEQIHIIRTLHDTNMFLYLALRRDGSNLGLARHQLNALEKDLSI